MGTSYEERPEYVEEGGERQVEWEWAAAGGGESPGAAGGPYGGAPLRPPSAKEGLVDDPLLANPLLRQERLGCGWMGAVFDWEGVLSRDKAEAHRQAWQGVAEAEGKPQPLAWMLQRAAGMKSEQVVSELFCWARDPAEVRRLARAKDELFRDAVDPAETPPAEGGADAGAVRLLEALARAGVPCAVACCEAPRAYVEEALEAAGLRRFFDEVIAAEDVARGKPDPESYLYAAQLVGRPPVRMVAFGSSNHAIEAARDAGMKCVAVASAARPAYELASADTVVRDLGDVSVINLKKLFATEDGRDPEELEPEPEPEPETSDKWISMI